MNCQKCGHPEGFKAYDQKNLVPVSDFAPLWRKAQSAVRKAKSEPLIHGTQGRE